MTDTPKPLTSAALSDLKAKAKAAERRGCSVSEWYEFRRIAANPEIILRLIDMIEGRGAALTVIRDMPISEQDNMLAANMRKVASEALAATEPRNG